jgi:hypothetical protein
LALDETSLGCSMEQTGFVHQIGGSDQLIDLKQVR